MPRLFFKEKHEVFSVCFQKNKKKEKKVAIVAISLVSL